LGRIRREIDVLAGRLVADQSLQRIPDDPASFLIDIERDRFESLRIHRRDDRLGGEDRYLVLG
jgi:hypothetical protein